MGFSLYFHGEFGEADRWFAESAGLAPARGQWIVAGSSLAYRSLIAGQQGRLEEQRLLAGQAMELVHERGIEEVDGEAPLALGVSLAARGRPDDALPLIERAVAVLRSWGQPIDLAKALLRQASVLRILGERNSSEAAVAEARSIVGSCPDPGILARGWLPSTGHRRCAASDPEIRSCRRREPGCSSFWTAICASRISAVSCMWRTARSTAMSGRSTASSRCPRGPARSSAAANSASSSRHPRDYAPGAAWPVAVAARVCLPCWLGLAGAGTGVRAGPGQVAAFP